MKGHRAPHAAGPFFLFPSGPLRSQWGRLWSSQLYHALLESAIEDDKWASQANWQGVARAGPRKRGF